MDRIILKDLRFRGIIGVHEWERLEAQEILVNLSLSVDLEKAGNSDDINDSVNYATIADKIKKLVETASRQTVEALARDIANCCLSFPGVKRVRVRVEKPKALPFAGSVGVEIQRYRTEGKL